jgi:hypothetical protein
MKEVLNRFIRNLSILTVLLAIIGLTVSFFAGSLITKYWPMLLLLFAGITLMLVTALFSASEKKFSRFSNTFMIASMLKILVLILVIGGYAYKFPDDAIRFSVTLLVLYIVYLAFEIYWLLQLQNTDKKD